jgi:hypothetical protein
MISWIGTTPWFFPLPLTLISILGTWGIGVLIHQLDQTLAGVSAFVFIALAAIVFYFLGRFVYYILRNPDKTTAKTKFLGILDGYVALVHSLGGLLMTVMILSDPVDLNYALIPAGTYGYNLFFTYALSNTVLMFNSAGFSNSVARTAVSAFTTMLTSVVGVLYTTFLYALIANQIISPGQKREDIPPVTQKARYTPSSYYQHRGHGPTRRGNPLPIPEQRKKVFRK